MKKIALVLAALLLTAGMSANTVCVTASAQETQTTQTSQETQESQTVSGPLKIDPDRPMRNGYYPRPYYKRGYYNCRFIDFVYPWYWTVDIDVSTYENVTMYLDYDLITETAPATLICFHKITDLSREGYDANQGDLTEVLADYGMSELTPQREERNVNAMWIANGILADSAGNTYQATVFSRYTGGSAGSATESVISYYILWQQPTAQYNYYDDVMETLDASTYPTYDRVPTEKEIARVRQLVEDADASWQKMTSADPSDTEEYFEISYEFSNYLGTLKKLPSRIYPEDLQDLIHTEIDKMAHLWHDLELTDYIFLGNVVGDAWQKAGEIYDTYLG